MLKRKKNITLVRQHDQMDCGPASLSMVTNYFGNNYRLHSLRELCQIGKDGVSMLGIIHAAKKIGFKTHCLKLNIEQLIENFTEPCILYWNMNHFLVLEAINKNKTEFLIVDPAHGKIKLSRKDFCNLWLNDDNYGVALFLSPTLKFSENKNKNSFVRRIRPIIELLSPFKKKIILLFGLFFMGSVLNITLPFLTEALIDRGVNKKNINLLGLIVLAQLFVFIGIMCINILRNWFTLIIGTKLSVNIIYSYLDKILSLPISFFDTKNSGDFNQRIQDNVKIEQFLTSESILTFFSFITLMLYSMILLYYDFYLFLLFSVLTMVSIFWSVFWLKKRELVDYKLFKARSESQEAIFEFYNGIKEMKLNQYEEYKKNEWIDIQNKLLKVNIMSLKIEQFQSVGFVFFNQLKNILVTFLAAYYVINNHMTLGALLSVSFIIGQMNSPVHQLLDFFRSQQDALLSFDRLSEVYSQDEEDFNINNTLEPSYGPVDIDLINLNFKYNQLSENFILENVSINIPKGKITAIVGHSGSGKTTLMKLLLKFFDTIDGEIFYGSDDIKKLSAKSIRENSGVVMQDGYIFNDTIQRNIVMSEIKIDKDKLFKALKAVNLFSFINSLPLKELTKIGSGGNGLSGGQRQRILIARAIYKNPKYIFLDEATSALDSTNEMEVHSNLQKLFEDKTVVIIAHRLSTVRNADQIVVLSNGTVVERGTHLELINKKQHYYTLVKNQLNI